MEVYQRCSPVSFSTRPLKTEIRDNWRVVLEYETEGSGPYLIDLSHLPKWDVQGKNLSEITFQDRAIPENPGQSELGDGFLINRMNRTQASVWHLNGENPEIPEAPAFTDVTESGVLLALIGREVFSIAEKLTSLDFSDPEKEAPFLLQGPFSHVPCQMVLSDRENPALLWTCSRGYGQDMAESVLAAGEEWGIRPAGENVFTDWFQKLSD